MTGHWHFPRRPFRTVSWLVMGLGACLAWTAPLSASAAETLPLYAVVGRKVSTQSAQSLQQTLNLKGDPLFADGSVRYLAENQFQRVPTIPLGDGKPDEHGNPTVQEKFDFAAIAGMKPLDDQRALSLALNAFDKAGLSTPGGTAFVGHSRFEAFDAGGQSIVDNAIDTHVLYAFTLPDNPNTPLIGPGANVRMAFDSDGNCTQVNYALYRLRRSTDVPVIPKGQADLLVTNMFLQQIGPNAHINLTSQVVYFAPAFSSVNPKFVYPYYSYGGTFQQGDGPPVALRQTLLPAVQNGVQAGIIAVLRGKSVTATAIVTGGSPPYTFAWSASSGSLKTGENSSHVSFDATPHPGAKPGPPQVYLTVTDADGLTGTAITTAQPAPTGVGGGKYTAQSGSSGSSGEGPSGSAGSFAGENGSGNPFDDHTLYPEFYIFNTAGTEWIGSSGGLGGSAPSAGGFVSRFQSEGIPVNFNWNDFNAWESDFKDPIHGGHDSNWADSVDVVFYTGHGNSSGWWFPGSNDDNLATFHDAYLGNNNLEWIVLACCLILQDTDGGLAWWQRWGGSFGGLHQMCTYTTVSYDNTVEGPIFANDILKTPFLWWNQPMKIREAWADAAVSSQPHGAGVIYGIMGVIGPSGLADYDDYYWNKGNVGPDIRNGDIRGYWRLSAPI